VEEFHVSNDRVRTRSFLQGLFPVWGENGRFSVVGACYGRVWNFETMGSLAFSLGPSSRPLTTVDRSRFRACSGDLFNHCQIDWLLGWEKLPTLADLNNRLLYPEGRSC